MRRRRGFTLVEAVISAALTVVVVGTLAAVYSFSVQQAASAVAAVNSTKQAQQLADEMAKTISNSVSVKVVNSGGNIGIKCILPAVGTDTDMDGLQDTFVPQKVSKRGIEKYGTGTRVWYYMATGTGNFTNPGTIVWRAQRSDDTLPVGADTNYSWTYYYSGSVSRWNIIQSITFANDIPNRLTTVTITCSQLNRALRTASSTDVATGAGARTIISRKCYWSNWRQ